MPAHWKQQGYGDPRIALREACVETESQRGGLHLGVCFGI